MSESRFQSAQSEPTRQTYSGATSRVLTDGMAPLLSALDGKLLDIGCGSGYKVRKMLDHLPPAVDVYGVDTNPLYLSQWKEEALANFKLVEAGAPLPFPDGSMNVVTTSLMLHHIPFEGLQQLFSEIHRVLREDGLLIIEEQTCAGAMQDAMYPLWDETEGTQTALLASMCLLPEMGFVKTKHELFTETYCYKSAEELAEDILVCNPHLRDLPDVQRRALQLHDDFERVKGLPRADGSFGLDMPHRMEVWTKARGIKLPQLKVSSTGAPAPEAVAIKARDRIPGQLTSQHLLPDRLAPPRPLWPLLVEPRDSSASIGSLAGECRALLDERLHDVGAVLLRGLPLKSVADLRDFQAAMGLKSMQQYRGCTTPRASKADGVFAASDDPPCFTVEPQQELSYQSNCPSRLMFSCSSEALPGDGGEMGITDMRRLSREPLIQDFMAQCAERGGLLYQLKMVSRQEASGNLFWEDAWGTEKKPEVESLLKDSGYKWQWSEDNVLEFWVPVPGFVQHPITAERVLFAQPTCFHPSYYEKHPTVASMSAVSVAFGDGAVLDDELVSRIRAATWEHTVPVRMQTGDLMCLDNILAGHFRAGLLQDSQHVRLVSLLEPSFKNVVQCGLYEATVQNSDNTLRKTPDM
eukprot:CAMPEP_0170599102 /NCGR_PEP_ID=MMETSP0224-20130122/16609_1 /TAXON_ID=285029 /ORGANISM="Togula jolla, Strain CCCM 725" /LENGTH=636 /DNA_ID=CAMNT_0010923713 /DNA_START=52 /DNA_END=1963 /DNA_ORIENTATION=+